MADFRLIERFVSINGEGPRAGELAVFLRFPGCNLQCSYCDTAWANLPDAPTMPATITEVCGYVRETGVRNVTITGGEPLLQPVLPELIAALAEIGCRIEIETNGSLSIAPLAGLSARPAFTLDYKLPGSGMESHMLTENYAYLRHEDTVKFVAGSLEDLDKAREIIGTYALTEKCHVYLSAVFGKIDCRDIVAYMETHRMNGVRLQLQLHKFIWDPNERGV